MQEALRLYPEARRDLSMRLDGRDRRAKHALRGKNEAKEERIRQEYKTSYSLAHRCARRIFFESGD